MFTDQMVAIMNDRTGIEKLGKVGARRGCSAAHFSCSYTGWRQAGPDAVREFAARVWRGAAVAPHPPRAEPQTRRAPRISDVVVAFDDDGLNPFYVFAAFAIIGFFKHVARPSRSHSDA